MSWHAYIDRLLTPKDGVDIVQHAVICGIKTDQECVWAASKDFNVTVDEIKKLIHNRATHSASGPYIAGQKCMMLRDELDVDEIFSMQLKTVADATGTTYSICAGITFSALIIAKGYKDIGAGQVSNQVYGTVKYLRDCNI